jgi:hypothetical protein
MQRIGGHFIDSTISIEGAWRSEGEDLCILCIDSGKRLSTACTGRISTALTGKENKYVYQKGT